MSIKDTLAQIKAHGMAATWDRDAGEYRVTYPKGEMSPARLEAVASYTPDPLDAIGTAVQMRRRHVAIMRGGECVCGSRNLRGVMRYAARVGVDTVQLAMTADYGALVSIVFHDGARCQTRFAGWDVAQRWFRARRTWALTLRTQTATYEAWKGPLIGDHSASALFDAFPIERLPPLGL